MDEQRTQRVRERAHEIWEREGKPEGRELEHWQMALTETDAEEAQARTGVPAGPVAKPEHPEEGPSLQKDRAAMPEQAMSRVAGPGESKKDMPLRRPASSGDQ